MIGKLRKKFILINMALVGSVFLLAFAIVLFFNYQTLKGETLGVLERMVEMPKEAQLEAFELKGDKPGRAEMLLPVFVVELTADGEILSTTSENIVVTEEVASEVTVRALSEGKKEGVLFDLQLRYLIEDTTDGTKIAFADMTRETDGIKNLFFTLLGVSLCGLAAFYFISRFLAGWALRPAEKAWQQQKQFVADASHELRTPLTVIMANTGILLSHKDDTVEQQKKWIENTKAEAERMKKLVDDLLFLAKVDAGESVRQIRAELDFGDVVWSSLLPFESVAFEQGVSLDCKIEPDIRFSGDEGQLRQLIAILLDNACKYAREQGKVTVELAKKQGKIHLSVHNTGEAIPAAYLDRLFERFYRVDSSRVREQGGYGLGLSIAASIVKNHGGAISVESSEEKGTAFTVVLS